MWKRFKSSRSSSSIDVVTGSSPLSPTLDERSNSASIESPSDHSRSYSISDRTVTLSTDRRNVTHSDSHAQLQPTRWQDQRDDPLGLSVLYAPPQRTIDIIFIHGLGGTSLRTWCRDRDLKYLWPKLWLPAELPTARILTFGYNANFSSTDERSHSTIGDFAADLLFRMKHGESTTERLGQVPIIVVAHSMGGLVFKKAYVKGHSNSDEFKIVSMIKAVLFLATPHHGTDLAGTLNKLLSTSFLGHSPKKYVAELARKSPTIDQINESFRHYASKLQIFSFYETLETAARFASRLFSITIVASQSAVMGYPNEMMIPLTANHHNVCKFTSPEDPNYASVIGALRSAASSVLDPPIDDAACNEDLQYLADLLGLTSAPEEDLSFGRSARKDGTCEGFLESNEVRSWLNSQSCQILWVHAQPGGGKSILCSFVIDHLVGSGHHCSYFFFKQGQRIKQLTSTMVRSLAYQTALRLSPFRKALVDLAKGGLKLSNANYTTVWEQLFRSVLSGIKSDAKIFWVIDGLDEAESSRSIVDLVSRVSDLGTRICIMIFSRPLSGISQAFELARRRIKISDMPLPDNKSDIRLMVEDEIGYLMAGNHFKATIADEIVSRSQGSFLWASLVTQRVLNCHREDQVKQVLNSTPDGMQDLYGRMMNVILNLESNEDKRLAQVFLTWALYSKTPITAEELFEVYPTELDLIMNMSHTVSQVCGQFVLINPQGQITLVHHSAREYLANSKRLPFMLDTRHGNQELLTRCLAALSDKTLRRKLQMLKVPKFLPYASTSWASHLKNSPLDSNIVFDALVKFFSGPYPLDWIQYLAMSGRLPEIFGASRNLAAYVRKKERKGLENTPKNDPPAHLSLLRTWAIDMMKLPAKFGCYLSDSPASIYQCIPALSPASSIIHQKFNKNNAATLSVAGIPNTEWDDCLARVSAGPGRALRLASSPLFLAVASSEQKGTITVWDTKLFQEQTSFVLGEHIWALTFNNSGSLLACCSLLKTTVWKVSDWSVQLSTEHPAERRAIEFRFNTTDVLIMISDQKEVYKLQTSQTAASARWEQIDPALLNEKGGPEGMLFLSTPSCAAFNRDCTQIAVAYPSFPLSIWTVDPPGVIARLKRGSKCGQKFVNSYTGSSKVIWHPSDTVVIGIHGQIFKWDLDTDHYIEVDDDGGSSPHGLACSPNGQTFLTMDSSGSVKVYDVASMSLIYKLSSEGGINQIGFSADSSRFFDLRGSYCNIWEPSCLSRFADSAADSVYDTSGMADDIWSDADDALSMPTTFPNSGNHAENRSAIDALDPGQTSRRVLIAHANRDGSVHIYNTVSGKSYEIDKTALRSTVSPIAFAWNSKQDRLAYSLAYGAITIKAVRIDHESEKGIFAETLYSEKNSLATRGRTLQLVLHVTGNRLLVHGVKKSQVLSVPDGTVKAEHQSVAGNEAVRWQQHPSEPNLLLCFSASSAAVFSWHTLERIASVSLDLSDTTANTDDSGSPVAVTIDAILDSHSPRYLVLRTAAIRQNRPRYSFAVLPAEPIYATTTETTNSPSPITPLSLPPSLASPAAIAHALGILPDGRLAFLDRRLWVCTMALPGITTTGSSTGSPHQADVHRHFFLPNDWATAEGLRMCRVLRDGTVLCPCKGQVAVLKGGLMQDY